MNASNAKKTVYLNASVTMISQIIQVLLGFAIRKFFIETLGIAYLGYNSVFSNILQMLNLADLGIGVAITSFLYKPLVEHDEKKIKALMYIYSRIYHVMGFLVAAVGIVILLFIQVIIPDATCSDTYLRIIFAINLAGTVSTYFLAYKRTLLIAEQKSYIVTMFDSIFFVICSALQIVVLFYVPNYITYLFLNVFKNIVSNIVLVFVCNKKNKFLLTNSVDMEIVNEYKKPIIKYVKDLFVSKIGSYIYYGTDNIVISIFKGSLLAGFLSNYTMVTNLVNNVIVQILASLQATYGHYISEEDNLDNQKRMTDNYFFINYLAGNFCMVCIMLLIQPFISLYFGKEYMLSDEVGVLLSVNFLLTIMIQIPSQVFVVYKLYHYDYPIVIVSAILNIFISVSLVQRLGIAGVLIGTLVTSLIYLFSRYFIISKFVFHCSYMRYLRKISGYFLITAITILGASLISKVIVADSWFMLILRGIAIGLLSVLVPLVGLSKSYEWRFVKEKFIPAKFRTKKVMLAFGTISIVLIIFTLIVGGKMNNKYVT